LRDITGNRRFWPVRVSGDSKFRPWELNDIDQVWAEALMLYENGEELFLKGEVAAEAANEQRDAMENDDREGLVLAYLNMLLPDDWDRMDIYERREFIQSSGDPAQSKGAKRRETVSNIEIWTECFGKRHEEIKPIDSYAIAAIMVRLDGWEKTGKLATLPIYGRQRVYRRV